MLKRSFIGKNRLNQQNSALSLFQKIFVKFKLIFCVDKEKAKEIKKYIQIDFIINLGANVAKPISRIALCTFGSQKLSNLMDDFNSKTFLAMFLHSI
jgi:hypothetical protein